MWFQRAREVVWAKIRLPLMFISFAALRHYRNSSKMYRIVHLALMYLISQDVADQIFLLYCKTRTV